MKRFNSVFMVLIAMGCVLFLSTPAFAQQEQGDKELSLDGSLSIPHNSPSSATMFGRTSLGYYPTKSARISFDLTGLVQGTDFYSIGVGGSLRYYIGTGNPKLFPFVGGSGGVTFNRVTSQDVKIGPAPSFTLTFIDKKETLTEATVDGLFGIRYYISQKFALDAVYDLSYRKTAGAGSFVDNSSSRITAGFALLF